MCVLVNEVLLCHMKAHSASGLHWMKCVITFFIHFPLVRANPTFCYTPTHPYSRAPHVGTQSHSRAKLLFTRLSVFFFVIISVPVASWSFQLPLFQCTLPGASGNNETLGHGKIISLPSTHTVVLTHDPGPRPSICLSCVQYLTPSWIYLSLPHNYLLTSPIIMPEPTCRAWGQSLILWGQGCLACGLPTLISAELSF